MNTKRVYLLLLVSFAVAGLVFVQNGWLVDDAFITFRTVENFIYGDGLTWNTAERVQAYTHPLWMFVLSLCFAITSELYMTSMILCWLLSMAALVLTAFVLTERFSGAIWKVPLWVLVLLSSKAFVDYTSSGLENPLSYLLMALFLGALFQWGRSAAPDGQQPEPVTAMAGGSGDTQDIDPPDDEPSASKSTEESADGRGGSGASSSVGRFVDGLDEHRFGLLFLLAALGCLNRMDTLLLYFPVLVFVLFRTPQIPWMRRIRLVLIATLPITLWIGFSLFYYGYPFPNTAYAKAISTGIPTSWKFSRGLSYLGNSLRWDLISHVMVLAAFGLAIVKRSSRHVLLLCGVALYVVFVVVSAASATHMAGRFFALPFLVGLFVFVDLLERPRVMVACGVSVSLFMLWSPVSAVKFGTSWYRPYAQNVSRIDTKWYVYREGTTLLRWFPNKSLQKHPWFWYGKALRRSGRRVHVGGAFGYDAIGLFGYAAGPKVFIIDKVALSDPLLSRLPAVVPKKMSEWKSGHFRREIPAGYVASALHDKNLLKEPKIRALYDKIRLITRGSLWSWKRLVVIAKMNLGMYNKLRVRPQLIEAQNPRRQPPAIRR